MATTNDNAIVGSYVNVLGGSYVGLQGVTRRDHPLETVTLINESFADVVDTWHVLESCIRVPDHCVEVMTLLWQLSQALKRLSIQCMQSEKDAGEGLFCGVTVDLAQLQADSPLDSDVIEQSILDVVDAWHSAKPHVQSSMAMQSVEIMQKLYELSKAIRALVLTCIKGETEYENCCESLVELAQLQGDSPHSSILQKILGAIQTGAGWLGINTASVTQPLIRISREIGNLTGYTGVFDQPIVFKDDENANAIVDIPQSSRSVKFHTDDWVSDQSSFLSSSIGEMDLLSRLKVPSRIMVAGWNNTHTSGHTLVQLRIHPSICVGEDAGVHTQYYNTPLSFFSTLYGKYRGSLKVMVEVVCTSMHQGQLFIAFNPYDWNRTEPVTRDKCRTCPFTIIDINTTKRYEHIVPFLCESDYAECSMVQTNDVFPGNTALGTLYVFVQNPLVAPSAVAPNVEVNVYIAAGDDFEFAEPYCMGNILYLDLGVYQMDEGMVEITAPVNNDNMIVPNNAGVESCCNVVSAETENILRRDYVVHSAVPWGVTQTIGNRVLVSPLPHDFWNPDFATYGLYQYHLYQHLDFEVSIKVNPSRFHAGMLIAVWIPCYPMEGDYSFGSLTQFPHCFIDIAGETSGVLMVPYSYHNRVMRTSTSRFGYVAVYVWNTLLTGAGQPPSLYLTLSAKAVRPYIGVKCIAQAALQGDAPDMRVSDAASSSQQVIKLYPHRSDKTGSGYINTSHMSIKDLMRRPDLVSIFTFKPTLANRWYRIARIPVFGGRIHNAIASTYTYWTGTNKLWFVTDVGTNATMQFGVLYGSKTKHQHAYIDSTILLQDPIVFNGFTYVKLLERNSFVVEVPMYQTTPMVSTRRSSLDYPKGVTTDVSCIMPFVDLYVQSGSAIAPTVVFNVYHSVGDDFQFYLWRPVNQTRLMAQPLLNGLIPKMSSNELGTWTVGGTAILPATSAYYAFDRSTDTFVPFATQTGRSITITNTAVYQCAFIGITYKCTGGVMDGTIMEGTELVNNFSIPPTPTQGHTTYIHFPDLRDVAKTLHITFDTNVFGGIAVMELQLYDSGATLQGDVFDTFMSKFTSVLDTMRECVDGFVATVRGLNVVGRVSNQFGKILNGLQSFMSTIVEFISGAFLLFGCKENLARSVGALVIGKAFMGGVAPKLHKLPFKWQSDVSICDYVTGFIRTTRKYLSEWTGYSTEHYTAYVSVCVEKKEGIDKIVAAVIATLDYIIQGDKALYDYACDCVSQFVESIDAGSSDLDQLLAMRSKIDRISTRIPRERLPFVYQSYVRKLEKMVEDKQMREDGRGAIPEPIGIYIYAEPGTGKSSVLCKMLPALLMSEFHFSGDFDDFCVNTALDHEGRMDKYDGQPIAVFDEFGSNRESNDVATVIQYISQFSASVQSALLQKKGKSFRSRILMLLSNLDNIAAVSARVNNPEAMERRFRDFSYKMCVRGKFDLEKLFNDISANMTTRDDVLRVLDRHFEFHPLNILTGTHSMNSIPFSQFYFKLVQAWYRKLGLFERGENLYNTIAKLQNDDQISGDDSSEWDSTVDEEEVEEDDGQLLVSCYRVSKTSFGGQRDFVHMVYKDIQIKQKLERSTLVSDITTLRDAMVADKIRRSEVLVDEPNTYAELLFVIDDVLSRQVSREPYPGFKRWLYGIGITASVVTTGVVAIIAIIKGFKLIVPSITGFFQATGYSDARWNIRPKQADEKAVAKVVFQGVDERHEKIRRNMRRLYIGDVAYQMSCLCIDNRTICINRHFVQKAREAGKPVYVSVHDELGQECGKQPIEVSDQNLLEVSGPAGITDLCILTLRNCTISKARSIRSFIPHSSDARSCVATLLSNDSNLDIVGKVDMRWTPLKAGIVYSACSAFGFATKSGDCGRPYVSDGEKPLMGIHCAIKVDGSQTYLAPIYLDMLPPYDAVEPQEISAVAGPRSIWWSHPVTTYGNLQIGESKLVSSGPTQTEFVPLCRNGVPFRHENWRSDMVPAKLNAMGPMGMFNKNASKYTVRSEWHIPSRIHDRVVRHWCSLINPSGDHLFTDEDAINGYGEMKPLHWSTSAGWIKQDFAEKGKNGIFEEDYPGHRVFTQAAKTKKLAMMGVTFPELLEQQRLLLEQGIAPFTPWSATLKDELRPLDKVQAGKTRIFEIPGLDLTIHFRREFGAFLNYVKRRFGFQLCHGIGANKEVEWKKYYESLSQFPNYLDIDYSNYDGSVNEGAFFFFQELCDAFYKDGAERRNARRALLYLLSHAYVTIGKDTILTERGNKSGNPMTDVFNSFTNNYILHCAILVLQQSSGLPVDPVVYHRDMRVLTYGDDVVMSVSDPVREWLDLDILQFILKQWGYTVTDGSKGTSLVWKDIHELIFLKSHFVDLGHVVLCPMAKRSIYKELEWEKRGHQDSVSEFLQRIEQTQQFMFHHGEEEYVRFQHELKQRGVLPIYLSQTWGDRLANLATLQNSSECEGPYAIIR